MKKPSLKRPAAAKVRTLIIVLVAAIVLAGVLFGAKGLLESRSTAGVNAPFALIVTDTSPLLTLALADSLDALLRARLPPSIPAVSIE